MKTLYTEYENIGNAKLAFRQNGNGNILILLHGNSESKKIYARYQTHFFKTFHTIAIDSRGHGETVSEDSDYSIDQYSDDIIKFCACQRIEQAYVIGYSDGGNISLLLAKKAPNVFKRIVAISPNYLMSGMTDSSLRLFRLAVKVASFLNKVGILQKRAVMRLMLIFKDIGINDDELRNIKTNVCLLYAEKDMVKEDHIKHIAQLIPASRLIRIESCNHLFILNKKETIESISRYLNEAV